MISTYKDSRLRTTIRESIQALESGDNIVIFPENSANGYLSVLEGFHGGFELLCSQCAKSGIDIPIYVSYYKKRERIYIFDAPVKYSTLKEKYKTREEIANYLCTRCNELGKMEF